MIIGCGVDIVSVGRFSKLVKNATFLRRFFHPIEVEYIEKNTRFAAESLAARFAAKEALGKALGIGIGSFTLKNICVDKTESGKPYLEVYGDVKDKLDCSGVNFIHLSLSHEKEYAVAQVILEKNERT